jgi:ankyrin repeat protein
MSRVDELIEAIRKGDAAKVSALLDENPALLKARAGNVSAILLALYHGHQDIADLFVEKGADPDFFEACALGDRKRARRAADVNAFSPDGFPALGLAIFFRHPELARELIERGADVNAAAKNPQRVAPLHAAAAVRDHATMKLLLERGADPNARQQSGVTPLHGAGSRGDIEMAKLLLAYGADPHAQTDEGKNAADIAQQYGQQHFADWFRSNSFRSNGR